MGALRPDDTRPTAFVRRLVQKHFEGVGRVKRAKHHHSGTNRTWHVEVDNGNAYFLTHVNWGTRYGFEPAEQEKRQRAVIAWQDAVRREWLNTPRVLENAAGDCLTTHEGMLWTLEPFVGKMPPKKHRQCYDGSDAHIVAGAEALAAYHDVAEGLAGSQPDLVKRIQTDMPLSLPLTETAPHYESTIKQMLVDGKLPPGVDGFPLDEQRATFVWLSANVSNLDALLKRYEPTAAGLTDQGDYVNHGNMHPGSFLFLDGGRDVHHFDYDHIMAMPSFAWDLAFSTMRFGQHAAREYKAKHSDASEETLTGVKEAASRLFLDTYETVIDEQVDREGLIHTMGAIDVMKTFRVLTAAYVNGDIAYYANIRKHAEVAMQTPREFNFLLQR